ncbi:MAG TPA: GntR family transcriptional regulator [Kofleriaceae bacterium]|nr:GntR family transcriptional regulator [Kofleriaceae bacterium]
MQGLALERIPKRSLTDAVFDQLVARIVSGKLAAGQALPPERLLCSELGVSRTAVREAMSRLAQLKLVAVRHGGETRVLDFRRTGGLDLLPHLLHQQEPALTAEVLRAGVEMRAALTPELARAAALRGGADLGAALREVLARMETAIAGDARDDRSGRGSDDARVLAELQQASLAFWQLVVDGTANLAYQLSFNTLRDAFLGMRETIAAAQTAELRDLKGYRAIARAIDDGDGDAAARAARAHIALGLSNLTQLSQPRPRRKS